MISLLRNQNAQRQGQDAENKAAEFLQQRGFQLISRNYQCRQGEIDLIMRDGEHLVFVEVRHRTKASHGSPVETITTSKRKKLIYTARHYIAANRVSDSQPIRFDVIGIQPGSPVDWIPDAFWE